jgi:hypothetical protein
MTTTLQRILAYRTMKGNSMQHLLNCNRRFIKKSKQSSLAAALVIFGLSAQSLGGTFNIGPFPDYKETIIVNVPFEISVFVGISVSIPFDGTISIGKTIKRTVLVPTPTPIFAATYFNVPDPRQFVGQIYEDVFSASDIVITDIWALDLNPAGDPFDIQLTGFDPTDPEMVPLSDQSIVGQSGTEYFSSLNITTTLGDLSSQFPDLELSGFSGDSDLIVYVSQTTVPGFDIIPSPGTLGIFALSPVVAVGRRRK